MDSLITKYFSDALTNEYDVDTLINELKHYPSINSYFLSTLTLDQLLIVKDLESTCSANETAAANKARALLKHYPWPAGLSSEAMDYELFNKHFADGVNGEIAFYYYVFDKCIERRNRNQNKFFMTRLATFAKASYRELWEESQRWVINNTVVSLLPNGASSKKAALLPYHGKNAADHVISVTVDGNTFFADVEEKPCFSVSGAIEKYRDPKTRYDADYLMMYLESANRFYIHNYRTDKTNEMTPEHAFPGYPAALTNID
jgi:hypothetical protein